MPRRKTIGRNPLDRHAEPAAVDEPPRRRARRARRDPDDRAEQRTDEEAGTGPEERRAEPGRKADPRQPPPVSGAAEAEPEEDGRSRRFAWRARAQHAIGGRLEFLGGDLGRTTMYIGRHGDGGRIGCVLANGFLDLESQVASITAWPDYTDHRLIEALGWGWGISLVGGPFGAIIGFTIRMVQPRHMIFDMRLRDGRQCIGRTDGVTIGGLAAIAEDNTAKEAA